MVNVVTWEVTEFPVEESLNVSSIVCMASIEFGCLFSTDEEFMFTYLSGGIHPVK